MSLQHCAVYLCVVVVFGSIHILAPLSRWTKVGECPDMCSAVTELRRGRTGEEELSPKIGATVPKSLMTTITWEDRKPDRGCEGQVLCCGSVSMLLPELCDTQAGHVSCAGVFMCVLAYVCCSCEQHTVRMEYALKLRCRFLLAGHHWWSSCMMRAEWQASLVAEAGACLYSGRCKAAVVHGMQGLYV
jgi:hypothetical protein